jgi:hypothetical protein
VERARAPIQGSTRVHAGSIARARRIWSSIPPHLRRRRARRLIIHAYPHPRTFVFGHGVRRLPRLGTFRCRPLPLHGTLTKLSASLTSASSIISLPLRVAAEHAFEVSSSISRGIHLRESRVLAGNVFDCVRERGHAQRVRIVRTWQGTD